MVSLSPPSVRFERADALDHSLAGVRTDVAAFVGIATRGPVAVPVAIESVRHFESQFGIDHPAAYLPSVVRAFFANGGRRCYIVRVAGEGAAAAEGWVVDEAGGRVWKVSAASVGVRGDDLEVTIRSRVRHQTETVLHESRPNRAVVEQSVGFEPGTLVSVTQGVVERVAVVSAVDHDRRLVHWMHPIRGRGVAGERPLIGIAHDQRALLTVLGYDIQVRDLGRLIATYDDLSPVEGAARYVGDLSRSALATVRVEAVAPITTRLPPSQQVRLRGGADGLSLLRVDDYVRAFEALERIDEVTQVAAPDLMVVPRVPPQYDLRTVVSDPCAPCPAPAAALPRPEPAVAEQPRRFLAEEIRTAQTVLVASCERRRDRIAILDVPISVALAPAGAIDGARAWRRSFDSDLAALYFPWLDVVDRSGTRPSRPIPPCGHVAGQIASVDLETGPHRAPANLRLEGTIGASVEVADTEHGLLNSEGINVIRVQPGRGVRVLGARTLSSDPRHRSLPVRRLIVLLRRALDPLTRWATFEPSHSDTWRQVRHVVSAYLTSLWERGAFDGETSDTAFDVKCDEETMPAAARDRGELICRVQFRPTMTAELVVVRVGRAFDLLEITEQRESNGGFA
ncbi:MAG: phage tail sheath subtilisin-like domain-containing protein [Deltaproteobacteria bacterium]